MMLWVLGDRAIPLSRWVFMKEAALSWALKNIPDLTGREGDMEKNTFQEERREQPKHGGQKVHGMFRGPERPMGLACAILEKGPGDGWWR